MPRRNRVTPFGDFEETASKGLLMGNRGILHDEKGVLANSKWAHQNWVACALSYKNVKREIMAPRRYTELFFCDEAVALAAGHRPCKKCRSEDYNRFRTAWATAYGDQPSSSEMDKILHKSRVTPSRNQMHFRTKLGDLPDGSFVSLPNSAQAAWLVWRERLYRWSHTGYVESIVLDGRDDAEVLTPEPTVRVLSAGYRPTVHPSLQHT